MAGWQSTGSVVALNLCDSDINRFFRLEERLIVSVIVIPATTRAGMTGPGVF
jgi:hypothetical protein